MHQGRGGLAMPMKGRLVNTSGTRQLYGINMYIYIFFSTSENSEILRAKIICQRPHFREETD